ncbi:MAG: DUF1640 domain-containing protein [Magnetococcales bacterium]|nr:DUF1640 domain-containing protein [Magnetococcales bacterium]
MSTTIPFDTLAFAKEQEGAGVPPAQAEAQAKALSGVFQKIEEARANDLATKQDLAELEIRLIKWMIGTSGVIVALVKFLPGGH